VESHWFTSKNQFALNILVPLQYFIPLLVAYILPKNFGFGWAGAVPWALGLGFSGLLLWIYATFCLGKSLAVLPGSDVLVSRGIYRYIRHPMYIGITLTLFGLLFACGSVFGMIYLAVIVTPLNLFRVRREEAALLEQFGESYRNYQRQTWF